MLNNCRFRGGGQIGTSGIYYYHVASFGRNGSNYSLSHVTFNDCEFERNLSGWTAADVPKNTVSLWEDNRAGHSHIEYLTFNRCHFSVKNPSGQYGAVNANIEFKTDTWGGDTGTDFSHNYHDIAFRDCVFEKSGTFNVDLTDSARAWADAHGLDSNWTKIPDAVHGQDITIAGCVIKGGGQSGTYAYGICFENPYRWTVKDTTIYDGAGSGLDEPHASWQCGGGRILDAGGRLWATWNTPRTDTYNVWQDNKVLAGFGAYTPSPYDP